MTKHNSEDGGGSHPFWILITSSSSFSLMGLDGVPSGVGVWSSRVTGAFWFSVLPGTTISTLKTVLQTALNFLWSRFRFWMIDCFCVPFTLQLVLWRITFHHPENLSVLQSEKTGVWNPVQKFSFQMRTGDLLSFLPDVCSMESILCLVLSRKRLW